ncbi:C2 NT-type domain-containing protein [Plasmodiophora brassicae]|uniref:C2 NT-type domain-containing protein n=1 Tax=Plasmodiophora brassicae TaxID=37360 RepID=A0A0G4ITT8_PLABS|nr:hypothetical protein PBRA_006665 [Plasmodiophora brassicae]
MLGAGGGRGARPARGQARCAIVVETVDGIRSGVCEPVVAKIRRRRQTLARTRAALSDGTGSATWNETIAFDVNLRRGKDNERGGWRKKEVAVVVVAGNKAKRKHWSALVDVSDFADGERHSVALDLLRKNRRPARLRASITVSETEVVAGATVVLQASDPPQPIPSFTTVALLQRTLSVHGADQHHSPEYGSMMPTPTDLTALARDIDGSRDRPTSPSVSSPSRSSWSEVGSPFLVWDQRTQSRRAIIPEDCIDEDDRDDVGRCGLASLLLCRR